MTLKINEKNERIFELVCMEAGCAKVGGTITFPEKHGRKDDDALETELKALYSHQCDDHKPKE
jgi:hypothetical protein